MGLHSSDNNKMITHENHRVPPIVPVTTALPDGREVKVDWMTDSDLMSTYAMIQEAAKTNTGFGANEFSTEKEFRREIEGGYCFAVTCKTTGDILAGFVIAISKFYRGSQVADPFIIVKKSERRKGIGDFCLRKSVSFAVELGFLAMYVDCFSNNHGMLRIVQNIGGFVRCGYLPMGGKLNNGSYVGSVIFYKDLRREE